jgi:hypothetical protein
MEPLTRGSFLEPLGEHSIGCVAHTGPARIGGRLRQILPDAWEPPEEGEVSVTGRWSPGSHIVRALAREQLTWKGQVWRGVFTQET